MSTSTPPSNSCSVTVTNLSYIKLDNDENCEIQLEWKIHPDKAKDTNPPAHNPSSTDYLLILPTHELQSHKDSIETIMMSYPFTLASGQVSGKVSIRIAGYFSPETECVAIYYDTIRETIVGSSDKFMVTMQVLPPSYIQSYFSQDQIVDSSSSMKSIQEWKTASQQYNTMAALQYQMQEQMQKVQDATSHYNPLLTITPKQDKWEAMIENDRAKYQVIESQRREMEQDRLKEKQEKKTLNHATNASRLRPVRKEVSDKVLSSAKTSNLLASAIKFKPAFVFLGAGISISSPSCSPSWHSLMSQVLEETFRQVPEEHQGIAKKLRTSDAFRSPEEIMETYYFILQKKLFTLFEMLSLGKPNANHHIIAKMAKEGKIACVMTTNFDEFIEQALDEEGVAYRVYCTSEEFQDYMDRDRDSTKSSEFGVLKIHGTLSRPETIVAVANHYKSGKGFGGIKSTVTQHLMHSYPTIFLGYSGWDFMHKNYQDFFAAVAKQKEGEKMYFVKYKGSSGGPSIEKLVGVHLKDRLVIGEGIMPELACSVMAKFNKSAAEVVMQRHNSVGPDVRKTIQTKQRQFLLDWVQSLPKISILAILWNESYYLNDSSKTRQEKLKSSKGEMEVAVVDPTKASAYMMQLASELAQGLISENEFYKKQRRATMEMTFSYVAIPASQKEELIDILLVASDKNPFLSGDFGQSMQAMMPSYLMMVADVSPVGTSSQDIFDTVIDFIKETLHPLYKQKDDDRLSEVMYNLLYSASAYLRLVKDEDKEEGYDLIRQAATKALSEEWTDEMVTDYNTKELSPKITQLAYGQVDMKALVKSMVELIGDMNGNSSLDDILNGSFIIAITLQSQAGYRSSELYSIDSMTQIIQELSQEKKVNDKMFTKLEAEMNEAVEPVLNILKTLDKGGKVGSSLSPKEVIATFDLANAEAIKACLKYIGDGAQAQRVRESQGYYPIDALPASAAAYLSKKMSHAVKYMKDDRAEQSALAMLVSLAESSGNIKQAEKAVATSLAITEGKVTEFTPVGIPEALAAMYQEKGDLVKALEYYKLALDGIRTFVLRQKTDAIVLNAVLVQGKFDKRKALKMAFEYSPFFSDIQASSMVGMGRTLLIQQCEEWAKDMSLSLSEARELVSALPKTEVESTTVSRESSAQERADRKVEVVSDAMAQKKEARTLSQARTGTRSCTNCVIM